VLRGYDIAIPTCGRPELRRLLDALAALDLPPATRVLVVDDRPEPSGPLPAVVDAALPVMVLRSGGRGPAAARNMAWQASQAPFVAYLDDDVVPLHDWARRLADDLASLPAAAAGSQGRVVVPLPPGRRPTDDERNVAGLATARFITADLVFRRDALYAAGGFDERFRRAYREDADLALRLRRRQLRIVRGSRGVVHPVQATRWHASLGRQRGNADDVLVRRLHGRRWRTTAEAPPGRLARHVAIAAAGAGALVAAASGHRRFATGLALGSAAGVTELAAARITPGPWTLREVGAMLATSAALPPVAVGWHLAGRRRHRHAEPWPSWLDAVLVDRDGTLVENVPYNGDPDAVRPLPGVRAALDRLRSAGVRVGLVTNQSGIARGLITRADVDEVHRRVVELLGPFDTIRICEHGPDDGCPCRKPAPGMVRDALAELGVEPVRAALIGDIGSDMDAAAAAGVRGILVPGPDTLAEEIGAAPELALSFTAAVDLLLERAV
jgi:histidinol-phosphate phosphatase family protein